MNGNLVRREISGKTCMTTFASEIALIEADKEADRKYRELITEAENLLMNMQRNRNTSPVVPSPSRKLHNGLTNKRVELIKNTELNIEHALSKSRNSQPELQSGSIKDLEHISPKRHFPQKNGNASIGVSLSNGGFSKDNHQIKCPDSPIMARRASHDSLIKGVLQNRMRIANDNLFRTPVLQSKYFGSKQGSPNLDERVASTLFEKSDQRSVRMEETCEMDLRISRSLKTESLTSSSSDSEERCEVVKKEPLLNFRLVVTV